MTTEILELMDQRRTLKNGDQTKYRIINNTIKYKIRQAKEMWMEERCIEIEHLQDKHDLFNTHKKIKEVTGELRKRSYTALCNDDNKLITNPIEEEEVWTKYIENLFKDNDTFQLTTREREPSPPIIKDEIVRALKEIKTGKAAGPDGIYPEILKLINTDNIVILVELFNNIYQAGELPKDWLKSIFIPIPKKSNARKCEQFRLISLMSQTLKLYLKIIHRRIYRKCEADVGVEQFGFRPGLGTRDALFSLSVLLQKCRDQGKDVFICFIDYAKAFDCVKHSELMAILDAKGLDNNDLQILFYLYRHQVASVRLENGLTTETPINRGVRQGCVLSPLLSNDYSESIFQKSLEHANEGIKINGKPLSNIRYADDTAVLADSAEDLQLLLNRLTREENDLGMKINTTKTKVMVISRNPNLQANITIYGKPIEQVARFKYLGCWLTDNLDPDLEIRTRIEMARATFLKMKTLLADRSLRITTRLRFVKCYVYSVLLYGVEAWTMKVSTMNRLEAFEMWIYRRMLRISWVDHVTNDEVLRRMGEDRKLLTLIKRRKTAYLGHISRHQRYELPKLIMEGKIEGRRGPGRRQCSWLKNIRDWTGLDSHTLLRTAQDRTQFAEIVANLR